MEVFLWVPTKGWKRVLKTKDRAKAMAFAAELEPLEVKVSDGSGRHYHGGAFCMPDYSVPAYRRTLEG